MSKGLKALERNRNFIERYFVKQVEETGIYHKDMKDDMFNDLSIIEKELKAYQEHEKILDDYDLTLVNFREACLFYAWLKSEKLNFIDGAKKLKALEIIKELANSFDDLPCGKYVQEQVIEIIKKYLKEHLKQEEYDLLREVML